MNGSPLREISDADFGRAVGQTSGPVVVEFFATWCGNCRRLAPVLERLAGDLSGRLEFVKINADDSPQAVRTYQVTPTPTLMLFTAGEPIATLVGAQPENILRAWLDEAATPRGNHSWVPGRLFRRGESFAVEE